jgi:hypothetical protein
VSMYRRDRRMTTGRHYRERLEQARDVGETRNYLRALLVLSGCWAERRVNRLGCRRTP